VRAGKLVDWNSDFPGHQIARGGVESASLQVSGRFASMLGVRVAGAEVELFRDLGYQVHLLPEFSLLTRVQTFHGHPVL
jgi:hypothetical protein